MIRFNKNKTDIYSTTRNKYTNKVKYVNIPEDINELNKIVLLDNFYEISDCGNFLLFFKEGEQEIVPPINSYYVAEEYGTYELSPLKVRKDKFISDINQFKELDEELEVFFKNRHKYSDVLYKIGFFCYGPPGNGKSTQIRKIIQKYDKECLIFYMNSGVGPDFVDYFNEKYPDTIKFFIFEEMTTHVQSPSQIKDLLEFLDGSVNLTNSVIIGCTNYPEQIPGNILRDCRFDFIYKFDNPDAADRKTIISHYMKRPASKEEVDMTKDYSIARLKALCFNSITRDISLEEAIKRNKKKEQIAKNNFKEYSKLGF